MTGPATYERRWRRSAWWGGVVGFVPQVWMLTAGTWNPLRWSRQSDFYDVQARALLDGTFAMDQRVLGIESFARGDQHFMYFGPVPALLRIPFVAATRSLDGRMAAISMMGAFVVLLAAAVHLGWNLRKRVVGSDGPADAPVATEVSRFEASLVALMMFAVVGGSSLLFAASRTWVYHEAILWGVALTLAAIAALSSWLDVDDIDSSPARRLLVTTSVLVMFALLTRPSVAGGALAALALAAGQAAVRLLRGRRRAGETPADRATTATLAMLSTAVVVPVVAYSVVNWLKFRRLFGVPFDQQGYTLLSEERREMLAANGGTLFNWRFVPTNLTTYLRPDLIGIDGRFPFVQPRRPVSTIGSPVYDLIDLTSGVPTTMPLLVVLAVIGAWTVVRRPTRALRPVRLILIGGVLGTLPVLAIGYLANRYQSDFLPLLVVSALVGLPVATQWLDGVRSQRRWRTAASVIVVGVLVTVGLVVNGALGYSYQRAYGPSTPPGVIADYLDTQRRVDGWFGDGRLNGVVRADELGVQTAIGDVTIIGACDAMYLSDGGRPSDGRLTQWRLAELAAVHGASRGTVTLDGAGRTVLAHVELDDSARRVIVEVDHDDGVMTTVIATPTSQTRGPDLPLRTGDPLEWRIFADTGLGRLEIFLDGRFAASSDIPTGGEVVTTTSTDVRVVEQPAMTPVCDRLITALEGAEGSG